MDEAAGEDRQRRVQGKGSAHGQDSSAGGSADPEGESGRRAGGDSACGRHWSVRRAYKKELTQTTARRHHCLEKESAAALSSARSAYKIEARGVGKNKHALSLLPSSSFSPKTYENMTNHFRTLRRIRGGLRLMAATVVMAAAAAAAARSATKSTTNIAAACRWCPRSPQASSVSSDAARTCIFRLYCRAREVFQRYSFP